MMLRADGMRRTVGHLDRSHHRTDVVTVMRTELTMVVSLALVVSRMMEVVVILLTSHWTDHTQLVLVASLMTHGTHGEVPGLAHVLLLR